MTMMRFANEELQALLPPELLSTDPAIWREPTPDEIKLVVGRDSQTGISGVDAAYLVGVMPQNFRKYTSEPGSTAHRKMSFAMWHLLLHRASIKAMETDAPTRYPRPKSKNPSDEKLLPMQYLHGAYAQLSSKMPEACRPLFEALVDATPLQPLSVAAEMVQADSATAAMLRDHLEQVDKDSRLAHAVLNALRPMVAREVLRNARAEIEKNLGDAE